MSVQMELSKIIISEMQDQQIIVLKEVDGDRKFPIVIGSGEAYAIERRLKGVVAPRPLTHELLASVIEHPGGAPRGGAVKVGSRPSDAIALGVVTSVPIYVAEHVLDAVS